MVKSPPVDAADTGSIPAQGTKIPCVSGQLSSSATARNARAPQLERRSCAATKSQCNQINKYLKIGKKKKARAREMTRCFGAEKEWCEVGMFVCLYVLSFHSFQSSGGGVYLAQMKGQRKLCVPSLSPHCAEPQMILLGGVSQGAGAEPSQRRRAMPHTASFSALLEKGRK